MAKWPKFELRSNAQGRALCHPRSRRDHGGFGFFALIPKGSIFKTAVARRFGEESATTGQRGAAMDGRMASSAEPVQVGSRLAILSTYLVAAPGFVSIVRGMAV